MSFRPVFLVLIALAMLFAPSAMQSGSASAAMPTGHHAQASAAIHCADQRATPSQSEDQDCCAAMCAGAALAPAPAADLPMPVRSENLPAIAHSGRSHLAKLPTPPPRAA